MMNGTSIHNSLRTEILKNTKKTSTTVLKSLRIAYTVSLAQGKIWQKYVYVA